MPIISLLAHGVELKRSVVLDICLATVLEIFKFLLHLFHKPLPAVFDMLELVSANAQRQEPAAQHVAIDVTKHVTISPSKHSFFVVILRGCNYVIVRATQGSRRERQP